jgi:hypothetical protein
LLVRGDVQPSTFVGHVTALPSNPTTAPRRQCPRDNQGSILIQIVARYATVIPAIKHMIGNTIEPALTDAGYRGHNAPPSHKFKVFDRPSSSWRGPGRLLTAIRAARPFK